MRGNGLSSGIGKLFIKVMVTVILGVAVAIPVVLEVIEQADVDGTTAIVLGLVPLFIALILLVSLAKPMMRRFA